jgi:hypothetical protein
MQWELVVGRPVGIDVAAVDHARDKREGMRDRPGVREDGGEQCERGEGYHEGPINMEWKDADFKPSRAPAEPESEPNRLMPYSLRRRTTACR